MDIQLSNIHKSFDDHGSRRVIFDDLSITFPPGEISVIVGKSGVGKSSLLNLISGIDTPDAGTITLGGQEITGLRDGPRTRFRRKHMGFVFQFFHLIPVLTVLENAMLIGQLDGQSNGKTREKAMELLYHVGLSGREKAFPDTLSGGEQQRLAIVRSLVHDPPIILADEPTGNLDPATGTRILDLLLNLVRRGGKTLVMVTHSREAMAYAQGVFTVTQGKLIPRGHR